MELYPGRRFIELAGGHTRLYPVGWEFQIRYTSL